MSDNFNGTYAKPDPVKLNQRELNFVVEYMKSENGTKAAISAGYAPNSAASQATRLLKRAKIRDEIARRKARQADRLELDADKVLRDLETTRMLALADKQYGTAVRCSELQGKHLELFTDKVKVNDERSLEEMLKELEEPPEAPTEKQPLKVVS